MELLLVQTASVQTLICYYSPLVDIYCVWFFSYATTNQ